MLVCVPVAEFPMPAGPSNSITCHQMLFERRLLFVGLSSGKMGKCLNVIFSVFKTQAGSQDKITVG